MIEIGRLDPVRASGIDAMAEDARGEGWRFVDRLLAEWTSGENRFDRPGERFLGAWDRGGLIGFGGLNVDPFAGDFVVGRLRRLFVVRSERRRGVGRSIVAALVAAALGRFRRLRVRTRSGGFFEQCGFASANEPDATHVLDLPPSRYGFAEPSEEWPREFDRVAAECRSLLGSTVESVHHIGSTSVPGLAAKPIVDVLPIVASLADVDERTWAFEDAGFRAWGEYGLAGRRLFTRDADGVRLHNVHVYVAGAGEIDRHLAFRDLLRASSERRREYAAIKRAAFAAHPADIAAYNDAKAAWIERMQRRALEER